MVQFKSSKREQWETWGYDKMDVTTEPALFVSLMEFSQKSIENLGKTQRFEEKYQILAQLRIEIMNYFKNSSSKKGNDESKVGADDYLPLLSYLVAKSDVRHLCSEIQLMLDYFTYHV